MNDTEKHSRPPLRHDIQGLRAISILFIVIFHAFPSALSGGFIGVDVFFVISGYLITLMLFNEFSETGDISLLKFYANRLKRLFPALLFMVIATSILALILYAPFEHPTTIKTIYFVLSWTSNMLFAFDAVDYFSESNNLNLFLHTWSLSVEEQFYILWPLLLILLLRRSRLDEKKELINVVSIVFIISIILSYLLSLFLSITKPMLAFYIMPSRIWQFACGGLVAYLCFKNPSMLSEALTKKGARNFGDLILFVCLFILILCALFLDRQGMYPGYSAIVPTIATSLIIFIGVFNRATFFYALFSKGIFQYLGRVSYSFYLWHWPILLFTAFVPHSESIVIKLGAILLSLLMANFSTKFIENPIRYHQAIKNKSSFLIRAYFTVALSCCFLNIYWHKTSLSWNESSSQIRYKEIKSVLPEIYRKGCDDWYYNSNVNVCSNSKIKKDKRVVLFGDSVAMQWYSAFKTIFEDLGFELHVLTKSDCPVVDASYFYSRIGKNYVVCDNWRDAAIERINKLSPDYLIFGNKQTYPFTDDVWRTGTQSIIDEISKSVKNIVILQPSYSLPFDGPSCLARKAWQPRLIAELTTCEGIEDYQRNHLINDVYAEISTQAQRVKHLDLNSLICPQDKCLAERNGTIIYRDNRHITDNYVKSLSLQIKNKFLSLYPDGL